MIRCGPWPRAPFEVGPMLRIKCPKCATPLAVDDEDAGGVGECTECGIKFRIPAAVAKAKVPAGAGREGEDDEDEPEDPEEKRTRPRARPAHGRRRPAAA